MTMWPSYGAFVAMAVVILYAGRRFYWLTLREAVTFRARGETERAGVWACRGLIASVAVAVGILVAAGTDWPVAIAAVATLLLTYVICARMNAECGTFFFAPGWMLPGALVGLFGLLALGPKAVIVLGLLFYVLAFDPFESLMPYAVNGLKVTADADLKPGRTGLLFTAAVWLAIAVAVPTALWSDYNLRADMRHGGDSKEIYDAAMRSLEPLTLSGKADEVLHYSTWERVRHFRPEPGFLVAAGLGFLALLACGALRLRFAWWPIHPVVFLGFGSWTMAKFSTAFFLGWLIKVAVSRFGGPQGYALFRPLMIGVIVGDLGGGFLLMIIGWIHHAVTGTTGVSALIW